MTMLHVTRYRIYPSKEIQDKIFHQFRVCTDVRNKCLDMRNFDVRLLPEMKIECPEYSDVHSVVLQNMIFQIQSNIKALSTLKSKGKRVGKLRHRPVRTLIYEQTGFKISGQTLKLSKIGEMPIVITRPVPGVIKQIILKFTKTHKYFVSVISRSEETAGQREGQRTVGIDMGLIKYSTDSDGRTYNHPHNVRKSARQLGRAQRKMSRKIKGSHNRKKQRIKVARGSERVNNRRDDFLHKWSNDYINAYDRVIVEKLNIKKMLADEKATRAMRRNINDAAWYKARTFLKYKAERAGVSYIEVDPAYTSQSCSQCGNRQIIDLKVRTYMCPVCGLSINRDFNAALNIRRIGWGTPEFKPVETSTSTLRGASKQVLVNDAGIPRL